jgi:hypothetical protein
VTRKLPRVAIKVLNVLAIIEVLFVDVDVDVDVVVDVVGGGDII